MRKIWILLVKLSGWHFEIPDLKDRPELRHCVVAVAPHTAFADYIVGAAVLFAAGRSSSTSSPEGCYSIWDWCPWIAATVTTTWWRRLWRC